MYEDPFTKRHMYSLFNIVLLIRLPSLAKLTIAHYVDPFDEDSPLDLKPGSSNISELSLLRCMIRKRSFSTIISACRQLKTLRYSERRGHHRIEGYEDYENDDYHRNYIRDNPKVVIDALVPHQPSLETIEINYVETSPRQRHRLDFRMFKNLSRLSLNHSYGFDHVHLPNSLKSLSIAIIWQEGCVITIGDALKS